jgi:thiol-disulfide isomerase/thioredoxin|tara:strand:- start:93 stop:584 length:492 start_codon:yes stop_codon:yes gene_type:complete
MIFANNSFAETSEVNKFLFYENPQPIDNLAVSDINDNKTDILNEDFNLLLINFWATWCSPCTKEMPSLNELQSKFEKNQLKIVTIATGRNNPNKIVNFFEEYNLSNLENYRDPKGKLALDLGVIGLPFSIIISRDKKDIARLIGPIDWSKKEVEDLFLELIKK